MQKLGCVCQDCIPTAEFILIRTTRAASTNPRRPLLFVRLLCSYGVEMQICLPLKSVHLGKGGLLQTSHSFMNQAHPLLAVNKKLHDFADAFLVEKESDCDWQIAC